MVGFGVFIDVPARAIHLGFGLFLAFLSFPFYKKNRLKQFDYINIFLALLSVFVTFYLFFNYENLVYRNGILLKQPINVFGTIYEFPTELLIGFIGRSHKTSHWHPFSHCSFHFLNIFHLWSIDA